MSKHAARETTPTRGKIILGVVASVVALTVLLGSQGSLAFWRTSGTVPGVKLDSGTIDLTVADNQQGTGSGYAVSSLAVANLLPGETIAATVKINNAGSSDFTWTPTASAGGPLGSSLVVTMTTGAATVGQTTYPRTTTCGGSAVTSGGTGARLNRGGASQTLCVQVGLPMSAPSSAQGASGTVTVAIAAKQEKTIR